MGTGTLVLLVFCLTGTFSAPLQSIKGYNLCAKKCLHPSANNLAYNASYTYEYAYVGSSQFKTMRVNYKPMVMNVEATVEIGWIDPCNAVVQIRDPKVLGETEIMSQLLTSHPLMVGVQAGMVTDVCADPNDEPISLNFKKGIMSQLQNSLPYLSGNFNDMSFQEKDIIGTCMTEYQVKADSSSEFVVTKSKDHKTCKTKDNGLMNTGPSSLWVTGQSPIDSTSYSSCTQVIKNKIVESVNCLDSNTFDVQFGERDDMVLKGAQNSQLTLRRTIKGVPEFSGPKRKTSLEFEITEESKNNKFTNFVRKLLKDICANIENKMKHSVPREVSVMIGHLYRTPDNDMKILMDEIKSGKICSNREEMEELFTSALRLVRTSGAVKIILNKIKQEELSLLSTYLYAAQLHLISKPSVDIIKVVHSAINEPNIPVPISLAVGSLVKKYCNHNQDCLERPELKQFYETLSQKIISSCSNYKDSYSKRMEGMVALKVAGNAGNLAERNQNVILACLQSQDADIPMRTAAAEAFRQSKLTPQVVNSLTKMVQDYTLPTEIRIASYLAVYSKAKFWHLEEILNAVKRQSSSQVRSFVLSHMRNLQLTDNPDLQKLRYSMLSLTIPQDFQKDVTKYSTNLELSKYWPEAELGGAIASNLIYNPSSHVPRHVQLNMTTNIWGKVNNVLETGIRMQDVESLFETLFAPDGVLSSKIISKAVMKVVSLIQEKGMRLLHRDKMQEQLQEIYDQVVAHISRSQGKDSKTKLDAFIRLFGEELGFFSMSAYPRNLVSSRMIDDIMENSMEAFAKILMKSLDNDYAKIFLVQFNKETYIPTVQGIPIQTKGVATMVNKVYTSSRLEKGEFKTHTNVQSLSHLNIFVGYSFGAKSGVRVNMTGGANPQAEFMITQTDNSISVQLDSPKNQELLHYDVQKYLLTKTPGAPDHDWGCVNQTPKKELVKCASHIEEKLGIRICESHNIQTEQPSCSFSQSSKRFYLEKVKENVPLIQLKAIHQPSEQKNKIEFNLRAPGAKVQMLGLFEILREKHNNNDALSFKLQTSSQAVKILKTSLTTLQTKEGNEYDLVVYFSNKDSVNPATDKIIKIVTGLGLNKKQGKVYLMLTTMHKLRKYLLADINVQTKYKLDFSDKYNVMFLSDLQLERFEVDVATLNHRSRNYIRQMQNINKVNIMSETKGPKGLILKLDSSISWKGSLKKQTAQSTVLATVQTSKNEYDLDSQLLFTQPEKHVKINIKKPNNKNVAKIQATFKTNKRQDFETVAEIDIPSRMKPYQLEGSLKAIGAKVKMVNLVLKKEKKPLYSMDGPIKYIAEDNTFVKKSNFTFKSYSKNQYVRIETDMYKLPQKQQFNVKVSKTSDKLVGAFSAKRTLQPDAASTTFSLKLGNYFNSLMKSEISSKLADFSADVNVVLKNKDAKRIKAHSHISFPDKMMDAQLWLDADRNPNKKIEYSSTYAIRRNDMEAVSRGVLNIYGDKYKYAVNTKAGIYSERKNMPSHVELMLMNKNNKKMQINLKYETEQKLEGGKSFLKTNLTASVESFGNSLYKLEKISQKMKHIDGSLHQTSYNMTVASPKYEVNLERKYDGPARPNSLQYPDVALYSQAALRIKQDQTVLCNMKLERKGKEVQVDLTALIDSYKLKLYSSPHKALFLSVDENGVNIIDAKCDVQSSGDWKIIVSSQNKKTQLSITRPEMREMKGTNIISNGVIELDIFKNSKPLTVQVAVFEKQEFMYILQAVMNIPNQSKTPELIAQLAMTPKVNGLTVVLKEDVSSEVFAKLEARRKHISSEFSNIQAKLQLPADTIEFAALVRKQSSLSCMGLVANGTLSTEKYGRVQLTGSVCGPAYLEFGVKRSNDEAISLVKLGLKSYSSIKISLDKIYEGSRQQCKGDKCLQTWSLYQNKWLKKENIVLIGAKLNHPQLINFMAKCQADLIRQFKNELLKPSEKIVREVTRNFYKDLNTTAKQILPKTLQIQPKLKEFVTVVVEKCQNLSDFWDWWNNIKDLIFDTLVYIKQELEGIYYHIIDGIKNIFRWIFNLNIESLREYGIKNVVKYIKEKLTQLEKNIFEKIIKIKTQITPWEFLKKIIIENRTEIIEGIEYFNEHYVPKSLKLATDILINCLEEWIMNLRNQYLGPILVPFLSRSHGIGWNDKGGWVGFTLPIRTPVASVEAAVSNIGFPMRQLALLPPRNSFWHYATPKFASLRPDMLITFDSLGIPVIPSSCQILLVKSSKAAVYAVVINKQHMELQVISGDFITKIIIPRDSPIKVVSLVKQQKPTEVVINKINSNKVEIIATAFTALVTNESVTFESNDSTLKGILSYHNRNDVTGQIKTKYTPDSPITSHHVSRNVALGIFKTYRNDKNCEIAENDKTQLVNMSM